MLGGSRRGLSTLPSWADKQLRIRAGGRSSVSGVVCTVFGASGFLGRYLVNRLGAIGVQCVIPFRGDGDDVRHLRLMGDLGMINPIPFDVRNEQSIYEAVKHSNVVINLLGREFPTRNFSIKAANVDSAETIARISKEAGVNRFLHMSVLGAGDPNTKSVFHKAKLESEKVVFNHFPQATVMRASKIFGEEDRLVNTVCQVTDYLGFFPMPGDGTTRFRPVFVDDVAEALETSITESATYGKVLELAGPEEYTTYDFAKICLEKGGFVKNPIRTLPFVSEAAAFVFEKFPYSEPLLTTDEVTRWQEDEITFGEQSGFDLLNMTSIPFSREAAYLAFKYKNLFDFDEQ
jgi:NADH dehydrogenase (ubiquinone) 1 alpha subcomplex subunit 9